MSLQEVRTAPLKQPNITVTSPCAKQRKSDSFQPVVENPNFLDIHKYNTEMTAHGHSVRVSENVPQPRITCDDNHIADFGLTGSKDSKETRNGSARSKSRAKSARRSSFVAGRIMKTIPTPSGHVSDLHRTIPKDLPEGTRMELLTRAALEYSLDRLKEVCPDVTDAFRDVARTTCNSTIDRLREEGFFLDIVSGDAPLPHQQALADVPTQKQQTQRDEELERLDAMISKAKADTEKYKRESEAWDELVQRYETDAAEAERLTEEVKQGKHDITTRPEGLTKEQLNILESTPSYGNYVDKLVELNRTTLLAVSAVSRAADRHGQTFLEAEQTAARHAEHIHRVLFPSVMQIDPKELFDP